DARHVLVPDNPWDRRFRLVHCSGGHARILGVLGGILVQRAAASFSADSAHAPKPCVPEVSSVPASPLPTATQWKPPFAPTPSLTPLAANAISFWCRPAIAVAFFSYHTTQGTPSWVPVKAMSGSTPSRVGSMLRLGSAAPGPTRGMPVC